jgi:hypothetical protein
VTRNVGGFERILRLIAGAMILGLYGALDPPAKYLTLLGLIPLASAISGFCPLYALMGINRCRSAAMRKP